jgi:hypothetical protein
MMIITKKALPRRTFLRGLGATIALPLLDAMRPALANPALQSKPAVRLGFVYVPNGVIMEHWTPAKTGKGWEFTPILKALEPYRDYINLFSGLAQTNGRALGDGPGDHARAGATWLTGVHPKKTEGADIRAGISADQIAAKELGKATQIASLELGLEMPSLAGGCDSGYSCAYTNTISWRSPTTPNPVEINPRVVFERLFGDGDSTDAATRLRLLQEQRSILDYVAGSIDRLETRLGPGDRRKLSEYLEAIRDIERRIQRAEEQNAQMKIPLVERPASVPDDFEEHARLMMDMMVLAFQSDMTRVVTLMLAREGSNRSYRSIGISDGHHSLTHHQNDPEKIHRTAQINTYHVKTFAYLLEKLRSVEDQDGTLLDNALILYGSSLSDGNLHTHHDLPTLLAGRARGQIRCGYHLQYPKETPLNNLLLTMLEKGGVQMERYGDATGKLALLTDV